MKALFLVIIFLILSGLIPDDKYYPIVKQLAQQDYDATAYIALATYQRQEDIPLSKAVSMTPILITT